MTRELHVAELGTLVADLLEEYRIPSAQIGVLQNGEITDLAVGVKDIRTGESATTDTTYQCGSMTKTWTALAFMQLVDEGKVASTSRCGPTCLSSASPTRKRAPA